MGLDELHMTHRIASGGLGYENIVYSKQMNLVYFLDWCYASYPGALLCRLRNHSRNYFKSKFNAIFEKLMIDDFLALTLVYADVTKVYRCLKTAPSTAVQTTFIAKAA